MHKRDFEHFTFYLGDDTDEFHDVELKRVIYHFTKRKLVSKAISLHAKKTGKTAVALLMAHGKSGSSSYRYIDEGKECPVQEWIDIHDGKYNVLIIAACNAQKHTINAKHSLVIHPNRDLNLLTMMMNKGGYSSVFIPEVGYVEQNYYLLRKYVNSFS